MIKVIAIMVGIFLIYFLFVNFFGSYELVYSNHAKNKNQFYGNGFNQKVGITASATVIVKRSRMLFGLFPTYIFFPAPKIYVDGINVYFSPIEWREINIKMLNYLFILSWLIVFGFLIYKERKREVSIDELLMLLKQ